MIYMYEKACKEAGMTPEKIKEIDNAFHVMYQAKYRRTKAKAECEYEFLSLEGMRGGDGEAGSYEIEDKSVDIEEEIIHKMELERLREVLLMLPEEDRMFIMEYFEGEGKFLDTLAEKYGLTRNQVIVKKRTLLRTLRKMY